MDQNLYKKLQGVDLGRQSDDYFRGLGFSRGRQDAIDFMHRMREQDPAHRAEKVKQQNRERLGEFTGRLQEVPEQLEAVRQEMGIPQAFDTFGQAGETARGIAGQIRDIAPREQTTAKQVGISAPRLEKRIASQAAELSPALETATRGLEASQAGLGNLLSEFKSRTQAAFAPFELEAGLLGENIAQEFDLFKNTIKNELDRELEMISQQGAMDRAQLDRATRLAELEQAAEGVEFQNLGDRLGIFRNGELVGTEPIGLTPTRGGSGGGNLGDYLSPQQTPAGGIGTIQGNWIYDGSQWVPIQ